MSETSQSKGFVLLPGEGRTIDLQTFRMSVKAGHAETGGAFALLEAEEPPGFGPPLHIHRDAAEAFYVIAGEYTMFLGSEEAACPAGSFIFIPAGVVHGFRVGNMVSRKLNLYTPAAMVGYFEDLSVAPVGRCRRLPSLRNRDTVFDGGRRARDQPPGIALAARASTDQPDPATPPGRFHRRAEPSRPVSARASTLFAWFLALEQAQHLRAVGSSR